MRNRILALLLIVGIISSCSKDEEKEEIKSLQQGLNDGTSILDLLQSYPKDNFYGLEHAGGIIFYINPSTGGGMVVAPIDQNEENSLFTGAPWREGDLIGTSFGLTNSEIGEGKLNTQIIIENFEGDSFAAALCYNLVLHGYSDWFLPSKDELNAMYTNLHLYGNGDFNDQAVYWSSTGSWTNAWYQFFQTGNQQSFGTLGTFYVRAVREF